MQRLNKNVFTFRDDSPLADILSSLHESSCGFTVKDLMAGFLGYVTRLWGTRAQRLLCYAAGSRPVEKDKNSPEPLTVAHARYMCRNVHAI